MAVINNGILGGGSGKIGPVIMSHCNGVDYIKSYVIPRDPKTPAQLAARSVFAQCVAAAKALQYAGGDIFAPLVYPGLSAFNGLMKINRPLQGASFNLSNIAISAGDSPGFGTVGLKYSSGFINGSVTGENFFGVPGQAYAVFVVWDSITGATSVFDFPYTEGGATLTGDVSATSLNPFVRVINAGYVLNNGIITHFSGSLSTQPGYF